MDLQIRIAADRWGKVAIIFTCQSKVSRTDILILCALHTAQDQPAQHILFFCSFNSFKQLLQFFRMDLIPCTFQGITEIVQKCRQLLYFLRVRLVMRPVNKWYFQPEKVLRYRFICQQHKILNQFCCHISFMWQDIYRMPRFIQFNLTFLKIKIHCATVSSLFTDDLRQLLHLLKHWNKRLTGFDLLLVPILQNLLYPCITQSLIHTDHRFCNLIIHYGSGLIDCHKAAQCQPVLSCIQRTNTIWQCMWQHWDNPVHQIYACPSFLCFPVQCRIFLHIIGHIRNMHAQLIHSVFHGQRYRIIQIFCIFSIDRDHLYISQIQPARAVCFRNRIRHSLRLIQHTLFKLSRNTERLYDWKDIYARIITMPEYFHDLSLRISAFSAIIVNLTDYLMSIYRTTDCSCRDKNICRNLCIIRDHKSKTFTFLKGTHYLCDLMFQYRNDLRLLPPATWWRQ